MTVMVATAAVPPKRKRNRLGDRLRARGFDRTTYDRSEGVHRVRCSQCEAMVINGVACHETGCPNARRHRRYSPGLGWYDP